MRHLCVVAVVLLAGCAMHSGAANRDCGVGEVCHAEHHHHNPRHHRMQGAAKD